MSAVLKVVPPNRTPEREALKRAIEEHAVAQQRLSKLGDAMERASGHSSNLFAAVRESKASLKDAEAGESNFLAACAINQTDASNSPLQVARQRLSQTEADLIQANRTQAALEKETTTAVQALDWAKMNLNEALVAVVKSDAATDQLVADYQEAQKAYIDMCKLLHALSALGCSPLGRFGEGFNPQNNSASRGEAPGAPAWVAAVEKLRTNADAPLPS